MSRRDAIIAYADQQLPVYRQIALDIHARPEVSNYEFFACQRLSEQLKAEGFAVTVDVAGHRTGFDARYKAQKPGPVLVFLAEYDALGGLGHACGHNLFGATSCLAAASLKRVIDEVGGEIRVYGTPGEEGGENGSAKGSFVREGFLDDVDAALCVHPGDRHLPTTPSLGCAPVDIEFWGRSAHAASAPEKGINALDALILVYNGLNALRQHLTPDVRIHGVITNGGSAPNIVPDYAAAKFYFRAATAPRLEEVCQKAQRVVEGAAAMTGAKGRLQPYQNRVENTVLTPGFDEIYRRQMASLGVTVGAAQDKPGIGSSDVGNVSQVVPTIQPSICITDGPTPAHSEAFRDAACSDKGLQTIALGAKALALSALELIEQPDLLAQIKREHAENVRKQGE
ncbi:MAG: M20 family metallopeptidase [Christensenellaceae bacterium]|nr:M20 family metallopeptidase [Christensenellaceae bacterium]